MPGCNFIISFTTKYAFLVYWYNANDIARYIIKHIWCFVIISSLNNMVIGACWQTICLSSQNIYGINYWSGGHHYECYWQRITIERWLYSLNDCITPRYWPRTTIERWLYSLNDCITPRYWPRTTIERWLGDCISTS